MSLLISCTKTAVCTCQSGSVRWENSAAGKSPGNTKPRKKSLSKAQAGLRAEKESNCPQVTTRTGRAQLLPTLGYSEQTKDGKPIKQHQKNSWEAQTGGTEVALSSLAGCPGHPGTMMSKPGSPWGCLPSPAGTGGGDECMFAPRVTCKPLALHH